MTKLGDGSEIDWRGPLLNDVIQSGIAKEERFEWRPKALKNKCS
jgi:hypothetical protein